MYTVYWFRYPHGIEGEEMICKYRDFDNLEKALNFLKNRIKLISSLYWAGGDITDEEGKQLYSATDEGKLIEEKE